MEVEISSSIQNKNYIIHKVIEKLNVLHKKFIIKNKQEFVLSS